MPTIKFVNNNVSSIFTYGLKIIFDVLKHLKNIVIGDVDAILQIF